MAGLTVDVGQVEPVLQAGRQFRRRLVRQWRGYQFARGAERFWESGWFSGGRANA